MTIAQDLGYQGLDIGIFGEVTHVKVSDLQHWRQESARINGDLSTIGLQCSDVFLIPSVDGHGNCFPS